MTYFKTYSDKDDIVVDYHNTSCITISQDTILQIKDCAIECIYTPKDLPIYGKDAVFLELSCEPNLDTLNHLRERYKNRPLLSNRSDPDKKVFDIYGTKYYYFNL